MQQLTVQEIIQLTRSGKLYEAQQAAKSLLETVEDKSAIWDLCAIIALESSQPEKSLECIKNAITTDPNNPLYHYRAGLSCSALNSFDEAIQYYRKAIQLNARFAPAHLQLGNIFSQLKNFPQAETHYRNTLNFGLENKIVFNNLGNVLQEQMKYDEAVVFFLRALSIDLAYFQANFNLATTFFKLHCYQEALEYFRKSHSIDAHHGEPPYFIALCLVKLDNLSQAISFLQNSIVHYKNLNTFQLLGNIYLKQQQFEQSCEIFKEGLSYYQNDVELLGGLLMALRKSCALYESEKWKKVLIERIKDILKTDESFSLLTHIWLGLNLLPEEDALLAKKISAYHFSPLSNLSQQLNFTFKKASKPKLKIGYVTGDLRDHATAHLINNMFKHHNRDLFEIFLFSVGSAEQNHYKVHIEQQCDHVVDISELSIDRCAHTIYFHNIDILIDMMGYTEFSKAGIFALKPAPIQMSYLGYPNTLGMDTIDYLIADKVIIPYGWSKYLFEKIIFLPNTLFITDDEQPISIHTYTRKMCGLPDESFIFCSFNNAYKIDLTVFQTWMEILNAIPNSVLWLCQHHPIATQNLKKIAEENHISSNRLIFAPKLPKKEHLSRLQLADICLDCFSINAGTTAIDSLWAGVPIIGFENSRNLRVTSSILNAIGLKELIATNATDYKNLAIYYAKHTQELKKLRDRIKINKEIYPLFKTRDFVEKLEVGFQAAWANYIKNQKDHIFAE